MDDYRMHLLTLEKTEKRFGSHDVLYSKYIPRIPASAEREYIRTVNAYMGIVKDELEKELYQYLLPLYLRGLDGVIIQDLGVLAFLKEFFPGMALHASTQMTITGAYGAKLLKNMGISR